MNISNIDFNPSEYLWIPYILFVLVSLAVSVALFYHWNSYSHIRHLRFRIVEIIYIIGTLILLMVSASFFVLI